MRASPLFASIRRSDEEVGVLDKLTDCVDAADEDRVEREPKCYLGESLNASSYPTYRTK